MAFYAGIDYSMSSPAIAVGSSKDFNECKIFYYTEKKKNEGKFGTNIYGMMKLPYESQMERFNNLSEWTMSILSQFNVKEVCIEGYSMGSKGNVFNIGENTGIMKCDLWRKGIVMHTPAPTQVKKYFTGKGNANKITMHDSFEELTSFSVADCYNLKKDSNPVSDIVDAYAMLCYGIDNCF